jgi:hypothetical protein
MDHAPLDPSTLSPAAQKALAAGPSRMMAARGMVALQRPGELVSVLYQLSLDADEGLAAAARVTINGLPEKIVATALTDPSVDPRVLDWLAPRCVQAPVLHELLITSPSVADDTIVALAARADAGAVDLIAQNEQRMLREPKIIAAMYANPRARMSTVDRAVELAIRNQVKVDGIAAWDELARVILSGAATPSTASDDAAFAQAAAGIAELDEGSLTGGDAEALQVGDDGELIAHAAPAVDEKKVPISKLSMVAKIRLATMGNAVARAVLVRDPVKAVALAAIKASGVSDSEAARHAGNPTLVDDVVRYIAGRRDWTRLYSVKMHLVMNPKTPLPESTRMLPHLRDKDLRTISKSKGVPSAVAAQAKRLIAQRAPGAKK